MLLHCNNYAIAMGVFKYEETVLSWRKAPLISITLREGM